MSLKFFFKYIGNLSYQTEDFLVVTLEHLRRSTELPVQELKSLAFQ
jgi:hypothetical protein